MSPEQTVYDTLRNAAAVTAIVGTGGAARIYPDVLPEESVLPAITFERTTSDPQYGLDGTVHVTRATMAVVSWATTRVAAEALADQIAAAMTAATIPPEARAGEFDVETESAAVALTFDIWY